MQSGIDGSGAAGALRPRANGEATGHAGSSVSSGAKAGTDTVRDAIVAIVAAGFRLPASLLVARTRGPARVAKARQVAMYLAHVAGGLSLTDVGLLFGRDRTTVAHACGVVEDARDRAEYDRRIDRLERRVVQSLDLVEQAA